MTQEEHDRKILMERVAVEELLLQEHISIPAAYEQARELEYERKKTLYWMCRCDGTVADDISFDDWIKKFDQVREENKQ